MTCHDVQLQLSLYLYGELNFASEEALESHLSECAFCQRALAREKLWHTAAASEQKDVPLDLLAQCRQDLRNAITTEDERSGRRATKRWDWRSLFQISPTPWSYQIAAASFLVILGFGAARLLDRYRPDALPGISKAGLFNTKIRDIEPNGVGGVRIVLDQTNQREISGTLQDPNVRQWLLVAVQDPTDPGIRVDSVEMLGSQDGAEVRNALLDRIVRDTNAAVRLKALDSVRRFADDPGTRNVLRSVLEHDPDPNVRLQAIDVLAPPNQKPQLSPELASTLEALARSESDDYIRERCIQLLRAMNAPVDAY
jgi:HEAT repeat protein/putative zinc finger protein